MDELESYLRAGKAAAEVLKRAPAIIQEEMYIIDICEKLEGMIRGIGVSISFPVNIAQNDEAAHYTASYNDKKRIKGGAVVKVDIGSHFDGFIADTAITISFNNKLNRQVKANEEVLSEALKTIKPGLKFSEFGGTIEDGAKRAGYGMIENLSGHKLEQYILHANESVPMIRTPARNEFKPHTAYAVEPFIVNRDNSGFVIDGGNSNIMRLIRPKRQKRKELDEVIHYIWDEYRGLPFASRWLIEKYGEAVQGRLDELIKNNSIMVYPTLIEANGGIVSQFEHTVFVESGRTIITTER